MYQISSEYMAKKTSTDKDNVKCPQQIYDGGIKIVTCITTHTSNSNFPLPMHLYLCQSGIQGTHIIPQNTCFLYGSEMSQFSTE